MIRTYDQQLSVHLPCLRLHGTTSYGYQPCGCEPPVTWPGCDVSRSADLCLVCARGTAGGTTRWSWLGCERCRRVERDLRSWFGQMVLPLGRHSIMNGVSGRLDREEPAEAVGFAAAFVDLCSSWDRLQAWGRQEAERLGEAWPPGTEDVPLSEWQQRFRPSASASVDAYERLVGAELPDPLRQSALRAARL